MPQKTIHVAGAWLIGVGLFVSSCTSGGDSSANDGDAPPAAGDRPASLVVAGGEPPSFNYAQTEALAIQVKLMYNVFEALFERMEDGSLEPLLAESYEVSDDGREYVFTLRDAMFHDGSEMNADDVVYSLKFNQEAAHAAVSEPLAPMETVEAVDEHTVRVTLSEPSRKFLESLSRDSGFIIPESSAEQLAQSPIGTGPFVFDEWRHGVDLTLTRFDDYWGELPYFEQVTWRFFEDPTAKMNALLSGEVDILDQVSEKALTEATGSEDPDGIDVLVQTGQLITYAALNEEDELFDDERIRQAIAHAINRDEIIAATSPNSTPTCLFVNPADVPWGSDYCPYPHDPERARELLAEAGAQDLTVRQKFLSGNVTSEILASQLEAVGITVESEAVDLPTWLEDIPAGEFQFTDLAGSQQIDAFMCPPWFTGDCVPEFDELLKEANRSTDPDEWADLRRQAVEMHADRAYLIALTNGVIESVMRDDLTGIKPFRSYVELDLRDAYWE